MTIRTMIRIVYTHGRKALSVPVERVMFFFTRTQSTNRVLHEHEEVSEYERAHIQHELREGPRLPCHDDPATASCHVG